MRWLLPKETLVELYSTDDMSQHKPGEGFFGWRYTERNAVFEESDLIRHVKRWVTIRLPETITLAGSYKQCRTIQKPMKPEDWSGDFVTFSFIGVAEDSLEMLCDIMEGNHT